MSYTPTFDHQFHKPAGVAPQRLLLLLHGTGGDEFQLLSMGRELDPSAALLSPRGQVLEGRAPRFFRRLAEGVFDLPDLIARTADLAAFVRSARIEYGVASLPVIAVGYSNGANMALSLLLREPGLLSGAVLLRAMPQAAPTPLPDLSGVAVYRSVGAHDPLVPPAMSRDLDDLLTRCKSMLTTRTYPIGHDLSQNEITDVAEWIKELRPISSDSGRRGS